MSTPDMDMPAPTKPIGPTDHLNTVEYWRELYVTAIEVGQEAFTRIRELHQPTEEEAEFWAEGGSDDGAEHDRRFPDCPGGDRCEGHGATIAVCRECGYEHDGDSPLYRLWPCPTIQALSVRAGLTNIEGSQ